LVRAYGVANGTKVWIDKAGRIVIPKLLRERLGFKTNAQLVAIEKPEGMLLKRIEQPPSMVDVDGLWVYQGTEEPGTNWEHVLDEMREDRIESILKV
jgi:AbrB family looped-hinge helix DNA binding protein